MILRPVRPQSPSGPPITKLPVGLTVPDGLLRHPALRAAPLTASRHVLDQAGRVLLAVAALLVGAGCETTTLVHADRLAVVVLHGDLALGVGPSTVVQLAVAALPRSAPQDLVREEDRRRHQGPSRRFALVAGVAEHDALVAGALFLAALRSASASTPMRDVGRLADAAAPRCRRRASEKPFLLVADVLDSPRAIALINSRSTTETPWMVRNSWPRPSPAITILLVVHSVSQPSRIAQAVVGDAELDVLRGRRHRGSRRRCGRRPCPDGLRKPTRW